MLPALSFQGTTKVVNKGVDVTIVANEDTIDLVMKASRTLVVRGISTAVLEITCLLPIDESTIRYYVDSTKALLFVNQELYQKSKHLLTLDTFAEVSSTLKELDLIELVEKLVAKKTNKKHVGALIIAAGMSSRMKAFKPLLRVGQDTLIQCAVKRLKEAGVEPIVVVTGNKSHLLETNLQELPVSIVKNQNYASTEMFDSILLGLEQLRGKCDGFFILPADVPMFSPESLTKMIDKLNNCNSDGVNASYLGKHGHPVLFSEMSMDFISSYNGRYGLKGAMAMMNITSLELEDQGILYDADTKEDYEALCSYRFKCVPIESEIEKIYIHFGTTDLMKAHCNEVALKVVEICEKLNLIGWVINQKQVEAAARLHDVAKKLPHQPQQVAAMIEEMGYGQLAEIIRTPLELAKDTLELTDGRAILYLSDLLVNENNLLTHSERLLPEKIFIKKIEELIGRAI